jgi:hypothetical protein
VKYVQKYFEIPVAQNGEKGVGQEREKLIGVGFFWELWSVLWTYLLVFCKVNEANSFVSGY